MRILVNGSREEAPDGVTVSTLVTLRTKTRQGIAVAVNGEVVPRSEWDDHAISDGDRVEVLGAKGGG
jgi:sulfur carrier protein